MSLRRIVAVGLSAAIAASGLVACAPPQDDAIKIGTTDGTKKAWQVFEDKAKQEGIKLDVVQFGDYNTPNRALSEGEIDVNQFQHLKFLAEYNNGAHDSITPVGSTEVIPLALFWKNHKDLSGIEGLEVAIPNDPTNQGRALNVLKAAGLVKLKKDDLVTPTPADVEQGASKVKITPVDAAQTAVVYGEGRPAVINNSFLDRAGIDAKSSIYADDPKSKDAEPYINVFATTEKNKDNPDIQKLVKIWQSPEVEKAVAEDSEGTSVPVYRDPAELRDILKRLQDSAK